MHMANGVKAEPPLVAGASMLTRRHATAGMTVADCKKSLPQKAGAYRPSAWGRGPIQLYPVAYRGPECGNNPVL